MPLGSIQPVGAMVDSDPNQAFTSINNLLGIQRTKLALQQQAQNLQTGKYKQQSAQAQAQNDQRGASEQQRLAAIPWHSYENDDGSLDIDKAQKAALAVAPTTGPAFIGRLADMAKGSAESKQAFNTLSQGLQSNLRSITGSWGADPKATRQQLQEQMDLAVANAPDSSKAQMQTIVDHTLRTVDSADLINGGPKSIAQQKQTASNFSRAGLDNAQVSGSGGIAAPANATQDTGGTIQPGTVAPPIAGGGFTGAAPPVQKTIPPGYMQSPNGSIIKATNSGLSAPPVTGAPPQQVTVPGKLQGLQQPGMNAPKSAQDRYTGQMADSQAHVADVSKAANDLQNGVGPTRYRNDQIQDLLNSRTFSPTGPGAAQLNWIASKIPGDAGDTYQKIGHYLAQNNAAIASKMGVPNTNMGAEAAAAASGNTAQNRGALLEITKVNDAMNTALDMYNRGLAKATNNGSDPSKVPAYRQAFGQNFDMNVLRYDDAIRRGDNKEIETVLSKFGPPGSKQRQAGMQQMGQKRKVLHSLADDGDLP